MKDLKCPYCGETLDVKPFDDGEAAGICRNEDCRIYPTIEHPFVAPFRLVPVDDGWDFAGSVYVEVEHG